MIKKYCIVIIVATLVIPCFAHFTNDIVSYAMQTYLNDTYGGIVKSWESRYEGHISSFNQNRQKEIEGQLAQELSRLNTIPSSLTTMQDNLNNQIGLYNNLVAQLKSLREERKQIQDQLNQVIQAINQNNEVKRQINSVLGDINQEAGTVNQNGSQLVNLEEKERKSRLFYQNKVYLSDDSIVQLKDDLNKWEEDVDADWNERLEKYNNHMEVFQQWVKEQTDDIKKQREHIRLQEEQLKLFIEEINEEVTQYNQDIQIGCEKQECEDALLIRRDQITKQKEEKANKETAIKNLRTQVEAQTINYNIEHARRFSALEGLRKEMEELSQSISSQQEEREQAIEKVISLKAMEAQRKWNQAQERLNQFKEPLNRDYGGDFNQFMPQFSEWIKTNQDTFFNPETIFDNQEGTEEENTLIPVFCTDNNFSESQIRAKTICNLISRAYSLSSEIHHVEPSALQEWRQKFDQKNQEITQLAGQVSTLKAENDSKEIQFNEAFKQYNDQFPERKQQYESLHKQLRAEWDTQVQQIGKAYELKATLLEKEHMILGYFLFMSDSQKTDTLINQKWDDFRQALTEFKDNIPEDIPGFSSAFIQDYEIITTILRQANEDASFDLSAPLSVPVDSSAETRDEEEKQFIFSWMKTSFISDYLRDLINRASNIFSYYNEVNDNVDGTIDNKRMFVETMFLKGINDLISVKKVNRQGKVFYRIVFDNKSLRLLPEGRLALPKGVYQ